MWGSRMMGVFAQKPSVSMKWVYAGVSGSYDGTASRGNMGSGSSSCPTATSNFNWLDSNFNPNNYADGFRMRVTSYFSDPWFGEGPCTVHFFRIEEE